MAVLWTGLIIAGAGWLFLMFGVTVRVGGYGDYGLPREVANIHAIAIANNIILGGYLLIVAGIIQLAIEQVKLKAAGEPTAPEAVPQGTAAAPVAPTAPDPNRQFVRSISVAGIPGDLYSDGSIDVFTSAGTTTFINEAALRSNYNK